MLDFGSEIDEISASHARKRNSAHLGNIVEEHVVSASLLFAERVWRGEGALYR